MFEQFTAEARTAVALAQDHARRLGHSHVGCEHLLLGLLSGESLAAAVLRGRLLTPERVEQQIVRLDGERAGATDLDRDALAAIGIDLDEVSAAIDATFGKDALSRAAVWPRAYPRSRRRGLHLRGALRRRLRQWQRRPPLSRQCGGQEAITPHGRPAERTEGAAPAARGHLPLTAHAKRVFERSVLESQARRDQHVGAEHLALALLCSADEVLPRILSALQISPTAMTIAINDRYREAS